MNNLKDQDNGKDKKEYRQWHPMFVKSIKIILKDARPGQIEIFPEVQLSSKPLAIDSIVIKKTHEYRLKHPIAQLFRLYNVIDYKSPEDYFSLDDFDRVLSYTRLHHVLEESKVDLWGQYTITCISSTYPRAMISQIKKRGISVEEHRPIHGIYQIHGEMYPMQIVVLNKMDHPEYVWPFSPFLSEERRKKYNAFINLFQESIKNPHDNDMKDLLDFIFDNLLCTFSEWKEVWSMGIKKMNREERREWFDVMRDSSMAMEWYQEAKDEGIDKTLLALQWIKEGVKDDEIIKKTGLPQKKVHELRRLLS